MEEGVCIQVRVRPVREVICNVVHVVGLIVVTVCHGARAWSTEPKTVVIVDGTGATSFTIVVVIAGGLLWIVTARVELVEVVLTIHGVILLL